MPITPSDTITRCLIDLDKSRAKWNKHSSLNGQTLFEHVTAIKMERRL